ncbi:tetratricopeptide repeat protein [Amylibacter sp. SFDW26]|uniref:tetratricopeptide repeat protein n=1 Tax=Amylibacter sp. SFDW26 TaxID=2652722 RepID=UPI001261EC4F|nr:tetratricopeptide repeat protein [Amylibacter sp. SFDW26]KAB7614771.1 tetratricopeptide repeat protein [Amylibacter sp. SFDW26]
MRIKPLLPLLLATSFISAPIASFGEGVAGSYLSANQANRSNDYAAAAEYYSKALLQDPDDGFILQNALLAYVAIGEMDSAIQLSDEIIKLKFGSQLSDLMLLASQTKTKKYDEALGLLEESKDRISPLLSGLLIGWIHVGAGDMSAATQHFDSMKEPDALRIFGQYHKALAVATAGDFELADKLIHADGENTLHVNRGSIIAHAQIMSQLGKFEEAEALVTRSLSGTADQQLRSLLQKMQAKEAVPFTFVKTAGDGISEAFLTLASVLSGEDDERLSLIYGRIAQFLRPDNIQAILLLSDILQGQEQFDLATGLLAKVPTTHPLYLNAEISRADTLLSADKPDAAIAVLQGLANSHPNVARVQMVLGDVYSDEKKFREASKAYSKTISMLEDEGGAQWFLYYARAVSFERLDEWDRAETDFRKALELSPDQPAVLNYLGYSLVEKRMKLEEAQEMIERAVKSRPNDGFVTDSLGWVLYRVGKFEEAVAPMERAVELVPTDPIINDHLGDVYWKVGRTREARFQWSRALSFNPEDEDAVRIRRKLDVGLDEVLSQEEAEVSNAN